MRRMRIGRTGGLLGVTATLLTATAQGQDATAIEEMARRLADIEKQNETLKTRVNELEAADADVWLTQERSDQIRGVVTDVLADAETRVSLQSSGMTAGWDDGFFLASPDGRFRLEVGGMVQVRYMDSHIREGWPTFNDQGQQEQQFAAEDDVTSRAGFDIPHARLDFKGHVFGPDTRFRVQGEFTNERPNSIQLYTNPIAASSPENGSSNGAFELLDAYILQEIGNGWAIRVGQFKLPFDRGWEVPIANQLTGERNTVALHMGIGRSQGIELAWGGDTTRLRVAFSDGGNDRIFDAYHFSTTQPLNSPYDFSQAELAFSGRVEFKLAGNWREFDSMTSPPGSEMGVLLGVGAHWQQSKVMLNPSSYNSTPDGRLQRLVRLDGRSHLEPRWRQHQRRGLLPPRRVQVLLPVLRLLAGRRLQQPDLRRGECRDVRGQPLRVDVSHRGLRGVRRCRLHGSRRQREPRGARQFAAGTLGGLLRGLRGHFELLQHHRRQHLVPRRERSEVGFLGELLPEIHLPGVDHA